MSSLVGEHLTHVLGPAIRQWEETTDGVKLPFSIVAFGHQPVVDATTFATVGLSDSHLHFPSGATTKQELLFCCYSRYVGENVHGLLATVGVESSQRHRAIARGTVLGPSGPLLPNTKLEALYGTLPVYLPDDLAVCGSTAPPTHFLWLVPISRSEAAYINQQGWEAFETLLERRNPDLLDLQRSSVV